MLMFWNSNMRLTSMLSTLVITVLFMANYVTNIYGGIILRLCPLAYDDYYREGNKCYKVYSQNDDWSNARQQCAARGADLPRIQERETSDYFQALLKRLSVGVSWIGLKEQEGSTLYSWNDGGVVMFSQWSDNQPSNDGGNDMDCVAYYAFNQRWNDVRCTTEVKYVCEKSTLFYTACPSGYVTNDDRQTCVKVDYRARTWDKARRLCQRDGGDLVTIPDEPTNEFIIRRLLRDDPRHYWIGFSNYAWDDDDSDSGNILPEFVWADGTSSNYSYWDTDEPNFDGGNTEASCALINTRRSSKWHDYLCTKLFAFICETQIRDLPYHCPDKDWVRNARNNKCYAVSSSINGPAADWNEGYDDWNGSKERCRAEGGDLVSIADTQTRNFVIDLIAPNQDTFRNHWIGLKDPYGNNTYVWLDGTPLAHNTSTDALNNASQTCAVFNYNNNTQRYVYTDELCSDRFPYICHKNASYESKPVLKCPHGYLTLIMDSPDWRFMCLRAEPNTSLSFDDSKSACARDGGELAFTNLDDEDVKSYVKTNVIASNRWYWYTGNECKAYYLKDGVGIKEWKYCSKIFRFICLHRGIIESLVDVKTVTPTDDEVTLFNDDPDISRSVNLTELCRASAAELAQSHSWLSTFHTVSYTVTIDLSSESTERNHTQCLLDSDPPNECCARVRWNENSTEVQSDSTAEIRFSIDKILCLCRPDTTSAASPSTTTATTPTTTGEITTTPDTSTTTRGMTTTDNWTTTTTPTTTREITTTPDTSTTTRGMTTTTTLTTTSTQGISTMDTSTSSTAIATTTTPTGETTTTPDTSTSARETTTAATSTTTMRITSPDTSTTTTREITSPDTSTPTTREITSPDTSTTTTREITSPDTSTTTTREITSPDTSTTQGIPTTDSSTITPTRGITTPETSSTTSVLTTTLTDTSTTTAMRITTTDNTLTTTTPPTPTGGITPINTTTSTTTTTTASTEPTSITATNTQTTPPPPVQDPTPISQENVAFLRNISSAKSTNESTPPLYKLCPCSCNTMNIDFNPSEGALAQMISNIQKKLKVNANDLSAAKNKKTSAKDNRPESQTLGYVSVLFCLIPFCVIIAADLVSLIQYLTKKE